MSRYGFDQLVTAIEGPAVELYPVDEVPDCRGMTTIKSWINQGIVGWDEPLETYFIQGPENADGTPIWWFGYTFREIPSPYLLVDILSRVFDKNGERLVARAETIEKLIADREQTTRAHKDTEEVAVYFKSMDELWTTKHGPDHVLESYLDSRLNDEPV